MAEKKFNEMVSDNLLNYVYALLDPRKNGSLADRIFYIGKGTGDRCYAHSKGLETAEDGPLDEIEHKLQLIQEILKECSEVEVRIIAHGFDTPEEAFKLESILIPLLGQTNKQSGHRSSEYWLDVASILERYDLPIKRLDYPELKRNILVVSLNQQPIEKLRADEELMERHTLGDWGNKGSCHRVEFIIGVRNSLVQSIFEINKTSDGAEYRCVNEKARKKYEKRRFAYSGVRRSDLEEKLCGRSIQHEGESLTKMGRQQAFRFFDPLDTP